MHGNLSNRTVQPELLDELPLTDSRAIRSRRDLRRVNSWMGNARIVARCLEKLWRGLGPTRLVELGAGDGTFLLAVAKRLGARWPNVGAKLVDRQTLLSPQTANGFTALGWSVAAIEADVFDWLESDSADSTDVVVANLFLHHFLAEELGRLLASVAERTRLFVACEPARTRLALTGVRLLPLIGCNGVTRHDASISVCAGFSGNELSALWPEHDGWELWETSANSEQRFGASLFSHVFAARRTT